MVTMVTMVTMVIMFIMVTMVFLDNQLLQLFTFNLSLLFLLLVFPQLSIPSTFLYQLTVVSHLNHLTLVHDDNLFCPYDGTQPVRHDKACPLFACAFYCALDMSFCCAVQRGSGFVEDHQTGLPDECPGNGNSLSLST